MGRRMWALAAALVIAAPMAATEEGRIVIRPVRVLDTSGEARDQAAEHAARARAMEAVLHDALAAAGRDVVAVPPEELAARCPRSDPPCLIGLARDAGGERILLASVHKTSSLILTLYAHLVDPAANRTVFSRELSFRGDTDDAWTHAAAFVGRDLLR